ncbi:MAG: hypothetical protein IRY91_15495 [Gemmatimonadaceae bacterium]|nr:hypothetical protein [Gemmatimonadaceae bacterium]
MCIRDRPDSAAALVRDVEAVDDSTVVVTLADSADAPRVLADAALAIEHPEARIPVLPGAGPYHPAALPPGARSAPGDTDVMVFRATLGDASVVAIEVAPGSDARDLLDGGADLVVSDQPAALQYAATQPWLRIAPLAWSLTYVLALPGRARNDSAADPRTTAAPNDAAALRAALADAVHAAARGAAGPFWWDSTSNGVGGDGGASTAMQTDRGSPSPAPSPATERRVIYYDRSDVVARDLAERLVALAATGRGATETSASLASVAPELLAASPLRAVGLAPPELARALASGNAVGYVLALPSRALVPRIRIAALRAAAPWLGATNGMGRALVPLVDTRASLIARRPRGGAVPVMARWDGTLHLDPPALPAEQTP